MNLREIAAQSRQDVPVPSQVLRPVARPQRAVSLPTLGLFAVPVGLVIAGAALGYMGGRALGVPGGVSAVVGASAVGYGLYRQVAADFPRSRA